MLTLSAVVFNAKAAFSLNDASEVTTLPTVPQADNVTVIAQVNAHFFMLNSSYRDEDGNHIILFKINGIK